MHRHGDEVRVFTRTLADVTHRVPEIVEAWRLTGDIDYLLRIVVPDVETYDVVYQRMIRKLEFSDMSASIAMEELKFTTAIPTKYIPVK